MKKVSICVGLILALSACEPVEIVDNYTVVGSNMNTYVSIWIDNTTGCQYYVYSDLHRAGMTARLDENGKPMGCRGTPD